MAQTVKYQQKELTSFDISKRITTSRFFSKVQLTPSTKLTLRCLLDFRNHKTGLTFPKQTTIADATGLTKASINRAVEELRKAKLIITVKYNGRLNYSFTNFFYELLKEPEESITVTDNNNVSCNNKIDTREINNSIIHITNKTKQIKEKSFFQNSKCKNSTTELMKQYARDKETAVSPFDDRKCAIEVLTRILKPETQKHAFAKKMFNSIQAVWNFDDSTIQKLKNEQLSNFIES